MKTGKHCLCASAALALAGLIATTATAQKKYDVGASDTEIKIGNINPYSGPASAYGVVGKTEAAYFNKVNVEGGINGRKINFISYDDAYSPPKAVEQARKLVESDGVLLIFNSLGTPSNTAIQKYMNTKKVPQLFVATGATKWNDPKVSRGPWAFDRTTKARDTSTPSICYSNCRRERSASCSRTTIMVRTTSRG